MPSVQVHCPEWPVEVGTSCRVRACTHPVTDRVDTVASAQNGTATSWHFFDGPVCARTLEVRCVPKRQGLLVRALLRRAHAVFSESQPSSHAAYGAWGKGNLQRRPWAASRLVPHRQSLLLRALLRQTHAVLSERQPSSHAVYDAWGGENLQRRPGSQQNWLTARAHPWLGAIVFFSLTLTVFARTLG